jgi:allantoicase
MSEFSHLIDLASARLGGQAVAANDDFFAEKENLVKPEAPVFIPGKYTDRGKWMDGWESRRRRTPGHDWCIVKLGLPGVIHSVIVDTAFFTGNFPSHCWIDGCGLPPGADVTADDVTWQPILARTELAGDTKNTFAVPATRGVERRFTHVRLNIFPDGGVARLRVMGEVLPEWTRTLGGGGTIDLASAVNGGHIVDTSDRFYGDPRNMLMPYRAVNMGDGWETRRRRGAGHDWTVIRLGLDGVIRRIELDTAFFKGNYPDTASVEAVELHDDRAGVSADVATRGVGNWKTVLSQTKLRPDHLHVYEAELTRDLTASHVKLDIYPDGGVSRFHVLGVPTASARRAAVLRQLNAMDAPELTSSLADVCAAPEWIAGVAAARRFASAAAILASADAANAAVTNDGWLEAFRHHPRIGERVAERRQSDFAQRSSSREQARVADASPEDVAALAEANRAYEARFGHVFIVCAAGKSAPEMLALLRERSDNDPKTELTVAARELKEITRLRLERLLK